MNSLASPLRLTWLGKAAATALILLTLAAVSALWTSPHVRADDSCDTSEQVACIPLSSDDTPTQGVSASGPLSAVAVPIPPIECGAGPCGGYSAPPCYPVPVIAGSTSAAAVPIPPIPAPCSPYRSIYTTINLANAADVRALRTLSSDGLRSYWRSYALNAIEGQIAGLASSGLNANARLLSIQVQSRSVDTSPLTAHVRTLEHWHVDERSLFDGSLMLSQDQFVTNRYTLSFLADAWYITGDDMTVLAGPAPLSTGG